MQQYERDTWYDLHGRILFTTSKGLIGVGLPRKGGTAHPKARFTLPDGTVREGQFGWDDVQHLPDGAVVQQWVQDDTLPSGPYLKERRWVAPFARASREDDYRIAWAFFAAQLRTDERQQLHVGITHITPLPACDMQYHTRGCSASLTATGKARRLLDPHRRVAGEFVVEYRRRRSFYANNHHSTNC